MPSGRIPRRVCELARASRREGLGSPYTSKTRGAACLAPGDVVAWNCFAQGGEPRSRVEEHEAERQYLCSVIVLVLGARALPMGPRIESSPAACNPSVMFTLGRVCAELLSSGLLVQKSGPQSSAVSDSGITFAPKSGASIPAEPRGEFAQRGVIYGIVVHPTSSTSPLFRRVVVCSRSLPVCLRGPRCS